MENSGGIQASLAGRYALALFGLASDENKVDTVGKDLESLVAGMGESADLAALVESPLVTRKEAAKAVAALSKAMKLDKTSGNFLGVMAENGRLGELAAVARLYKRLAADARGEVSAQIVSARPLDASQLTALKSKLKAREGRDVTLETSVDPDLLGGLVIRLGSQMIDASIKTKLNNLASAMKG